MHPKRRGQTFTDSGLGACSTGYHRLLGTIVHRVVRVPGYPGTLPGGQLSSAEVLGGATFGTNRELTSGLGQGVKVKK
eukprot:3813751-Rhodomonas_salina.1